MKPTIQFTEKSTRDLSDRESRKGSAFPKTDYSFQAASVTSGGGRGFGVRRPSFRTISQEYFKNEEPRSFAGEAALFVVIVMTAALPIISSASIATAARAAGAAGFVTKSVAVGLALPGIGIGYLIASDGRWSQRLARLAVRSGAARSGRSGSHACRSG